MAKYLDYEGLAHYHSLLQLYIGNRILQLAQSPVTSTDQSILINSADLGVNVDNVTIKKYTNGANKGKLYVDTTNGLPQLDATPALRITPYLNSNSNNPAYTSDGSKVTRGDLLIELVLKSSDKFLSLDSNGLTATLTIAKYSGASLSTVFPSNSNNIKEAYALVDKNNLPVGEPIPVYKDQTLLSAKLLHYYTNGNDEVKPLYDPTNSSWESNDYWQDIDALIANGTIDPSVQNSSFATMDPSCFTTDQCGDKYLALCFAYRLSDGTISVVCLPLANFLTENEFGNGLQQTNGVVSVKIDSSSEKLNVGGTNKDVLTVTSSGIKVANIADYVSGIVNDLDSTKAGYSSDSDKHWNLTGTGSPDDFANGEFVGVKVSQVNGLINSVEVKTHDIASASSLTAEVTRATTTEQAIINSIGGNYNPTSHTGSVYTSSASNTIANNNNLASDIHSLDAALAAVLSGSIPSITYGSQDGVIDPTKDVDKLFRESITYSFSLPKILSSFTLSDVITLNGNTPTSITGTFSSSSTGGTEYPLSVVLQSGDNYLLRYTSGQNTTDLYGLTKSGDTLVFDHSLASGSTLSYYITELTLTT